MDNFNKLQDVFRDIFDDEDLILTKESEANDIEDWDSLAHINIIVACENTFKIKFDIQEITSFRNVGDMLDLIERKQK